MRDAPPPRMHHTGIQVRFADTDALGHLNNASYALYAEAARLDFLARLGEEVRSLILAHLAIDFRRQVSYGEPVHVETGVERLGRSSIALRQRVVAAGALAAEVRSVVVLYDYAGGRALALPEELRARLAPYLAAPAAGEETAGGR